MIYDAFFILASTINLNNLYEKIPKSHTVSCEKEIKWDYGDEFIDNLKSTDFNGLSGPIQFDSVTGHRQNLTLDIVDLTKQGLSLFGHWSDRVAESPIQIVKNFEKIKAEIKEKLNRHLIVTTLLV